MNQPTRDVPLRTVVWAVLLSAALLLGSQQYMRFRKAKDLSNVIATNILSADFEQAIIGLNEAIRLNPKDALAYSTRGRAHVLNKQLDKGIEDFSEAIRLDPNNAKNWYARGFAYQASGDYERAINDYTEALRIEPDNVNWLLRRGSAFSKQGQLEKAISDCDEALQLDPTSGRAYSNRGVAYKKKGEFERALKDLQEGIRLDPKDGIAHNNLAMFQCACPDEVFRDGTEALRMATKACELTEWKSWFCIATLAAAYAETGDFERAINYQEQALGMFGATEKERVGERRRLELYRQHKPYHGFDK